jgi:tetratricopeptide (TPR) repeat protein
MKKILVVFILFFAVFQAFGQISEEAKRHFAKGLTIVETAKSPADFEDALKEFEIATANAPNLAAAYFNIAAIQENLGRYEQAISNFKRYLQILPNAKDAQAVKEIINKTEQKFESKRKTVENYRKITGVWSFAYGWWFDDYAFYLDGDEPKLKIYNSAPKDLSVTFDGKNLKAKWRGKLNGASYSNLEVIELSAVLNNDGVMRGTLREIVGGTELRSFNVGINRNLLNSTYLWQGAFNGVMDWRTLYGGKFILENTNKGYNRTFPKVGMHDYERDFSLEAKMTFLDGKEDNFYGIIWGNIRDIFYYFGITANGNYAYRKMTGGNWSEILRYRPSDYIYQGNTANTLTVKKKGARMEFYINGTLVDYASADKFDGFIGFHLNDVMKVEVEYLRMDY